MPNFDVDESIHISPEEFVDKCSPSEIVQLIDLLEDETEFKNRYYDADEIKDDATRSYSHHEFLQHLTALRRAWYQVSKEDAEIIAILSKKYGSV